MGSKPSGGLLLPAPLRVFRKRVLELKPHNWGATLSFRQISKPLIDSAAATPNDWLRVRSVLEKEWSDFDGFVVVYGTDTMPYVAAFLSFAIDRLDKPVVVTGSMKPIFEKNGDAEANLAASVRVAVSRTVDGGTIDQVLLCFGGRILRGNRAAKIGSGEAAIDTPRVSDLGYFDTRGKFLGMLSWKPGMPPTVSRKKNAEAAFPAMVESRVALVRLYPGITPGAVRAMLDGQEGAIVEAYGSGTGPEDIRQCLERIAEDEDKFIVITTEVVWGQVSVGKYGTDLVKADGPLIPGGSMLAEAALAKLHFLLGIAHRNRGGWRDWVKDTMRESIRGDNDASTSASLGRARAHRTSSSSRPSRSAAQRSKRRLGGSTR